MKNYLLSKINVIVAAMLFLVVAAIMQPPNIKADPIIVGGATTTDYMVFYQTYTDGTGEYLYTAADIAAGGGEEGVINKIALHVSGASVNGTYNWANFRICLANSTLQTLTTSQPINDYTTVYSRTNWNYSLAHNEQFGTSTQYANNDWMEFTLDTPFEYTGGSLLFKICYGKDNWGGSDTYFQGEAIANRTWWYYGDRWNADICVPFALNYNTFRPQVRLELEMGPTVTEVYPQNMEIAVNPINGDLITPWMGIKRKQGEYPDLQASFVIKEENGAVAFRATETAAPYSEWISIPTTTYGTPFTQYFGRANGTRAENLPSANSRMNFRSALVAGGSYSVEGKIRYTKSGTLKEYTKTASFEVMYDYDIAIVALTSPESYSTQSTVYPLVHDRTIPFNCIIRNIGKNPIQHVLVEFTVKNGDGTIATVKDKWTRVIDLPNPLLRGQEFAVEINEFTADSLIIFDNGLYYLNIDVTINQSVYETYVNDNHRVVDFFLDYPYDGAIGDIVFPSNYDTEMYANQPYFPIINAVNYAGAFAASGVPLQVVIVRGNNMYPNPDTVYNVTELIPELPRLSVPVDVELTKPFIPDSEGEYTLLVRIDGTTDANEGNNFDMLLFSVNPSMSGRYTVGTTQSGDRNYSTIESAVADVYKKGVKDTVTFELTDANYYVGSVLQDYALEFTSKVAGMNANKLIEFVPSEYLSYFNNAINIHLTSGTGVGMYFASAMSSPYPDAAVNRIATSRSLEANERPKDYYAFNSPITFNGGNNRSIHFQLTDATIGSNRVPIMLAQGASNVTIKNCIITGRPLANPEVPSVFHDLKFNSWTFNPHSNVSAGILIRNTRPADVNGVNSQSLDTVLCSNNLFDNNQIQNGSYGIISLGIGALYSVQLGYCNSYYNENNQFTNNLITSQDIAGIFLGYEHNAVVRHNTITVIGFDALGNTESVGIMLGGLGKDKDRNGGSFLGTAGYNNYNVVIDGNEISRVISQNGDAYGIRIEQELNTFAYMHLIGTKWFPSNNDSITVMNNVIWGIQTSPSNVEGSKYGIRLFASRTYEPVNRFDAFSARRDTNLTISYCNIANNTVVISEDSDKKINGVNAYIGGIVAQDVNNMQIFNNAVAILDTNNLADIVAPLVLQSVVPSTTSNILIDNNIYYYQDNIAIRFIEQSDRNGFTIKNPGSKAQFVGLEQWGYYSNNDELSSIHNFYDNLYFTNTNPQSMRIIEPTPIGSYLNNRGRALSYVTNDFFGNQRGSLDQEYDIGAWEFTGSAYQNDLEVLSFVSPLAYRDNIHSVFREAEYVMTKRPVEVIVKIRNNGSSRIQNRPVTLNIYQVEDVTGATTLIRSFIKDVNIAASETVSLNFDINNDKDFVFPQTYSELPSIIAASRFMPMVNNVTPIYRFKVTVPSDEDSTNNSNDYMPTATSGMHKDVRYYIKKSKIGTIISVDSADMLAPSIVEDYEGFIEQNIQVLTERQFSKVASYMNYRALRDGLNALNILYNENGYDVFDRTHWEPISVNYTIYRYMFWADALNDELTTDQENDIVKFMQDATTAYRKNIIMSSEEIARNSAAKYALENEPDFIKSIFSVTPKNTGIYSPVFEDNATARTVQIIGSELIPNITTTLRNTNLARLTQAKDRSYQPAIFENYGTIRRTSAQAFFYSQPTATKREDKTFGLLTYSVEDNAIYLGVDWRNYSDPSLIISAILNFIGGFVEDPEDLQVPVELLDFDAFVANNQVMINWRTANEVNSKEFVVEKAHNNHNIGFSPIYTTQAKGSTLLSNDYKTADANIVSGNTYTYRLKTIDFNGNSTYSNEKVVSIDASNNFITLDKPTPSPATDEIAVSFNLSTEMNVRLSIYDITGKELVVISEVTYNGANKLTYNLAGLPTGSYNLVISANGNVLSQPFNIVK